jgi:hypothetical protein
MKEALYMLPYKAYDRESEKWKEARKIINLGAEARQEKNNG